MNKVGKVKAVIDYYDEKYPNPTTPLKHKNIYELFVAALLSAVMKDDRLNKITPKFFEEYPNIEQLADADLEKVQSLLSSVNFYKTKSRNLIKSANIIKDEYNSKIPNTQKELISLPGVGRKIANVLLNEGFDKNVGIVVDTHVIRLSQRLGLTSEEDPNKIEEELKKVVPKEYWKDISLWFIRHGKTICTSRSPKCEQCSFKSFCPSYKCFE